MRYRQRKRESVNLNEDGERTMSFDFSMEISHVADKQNSTKWK